MRRRELLSRSAPVVLGVVAILSGCGSSSSDSRGAPTTPSTVSEAPAIWHINGAINDNHGHKVTLNWGQIETGTEVSLPLFGHPSHSHRVTLSPEELIRIADGEQVVTTSSPGGGHTHIVQFSWRDNLDRGSP